MENTVALPDTLTDKTGSLGRAKAKNPQASKLPWRDRVAETTGVLRLTETDTTPTDTGVDLTFLDVVLSDSPSPPERESQVVGTDATK